MLDYKLYHAQLVGMSLRFDYVRVKTLRRETERDYVEFGNQPRVQWPMTWQMVETIEELVPECGVAGGIIWIGLVLSYFMVL